MPTNTLKTAQGPTTHTPEKATDERPPLAETGIILDKQTGTLIATYTKTTLHYP